MKLILFILLPLFIILTGFDNPCDKTIVKKDGSTVFLYYPFCKDSTCFFARTFEKGILLNEVWVNKGQPAGIENCYSRDKNNLLASTFYWGKDREHFSISYFEGTNRTAHALQILNDSTYFDMTFYMNGNIKAYGLTTKSYCNFGIWTEVDSLGKMKSSGKYKVVQKEERKPNEAGTVVVSWCFEKDSVWTVTDSKNKIVEQKIYSDGKSKTYR